MYDLVNQLVREIIQSKKSKEGRGDSIQKSVPLYQRAPEMASVGNQIHYTHKNIVGTSAKIKILHHLPNVNLMHRLMFVSRKENSSGSLGSSRDRAQNPLSFNSN
jgi:hypothetical protein